MSTNRIWDGRTVAIREAEAVRDLLMNRAQIEADLYTILGDEIDAVLDPINKNPIPFKAFSDTLPVEVNQEPIQEMHTSIQRVLDKLRAIFGDLRPPTLAPFGLEKAIPSGLIQLYRQLFRGE